MLNRFAILGTLVAVLALAPVVQAAPFLVGGMSFASTTVGPGLSPLVPVTSTGTALTSYTGATGLDFTTTGALTPGVAGSFQVNGTSGDFNLLNGLFGTIKDFSFSGAGTSAYPVPPIVGFEVITSPAFSFDLMSVNVQTQDPNILTLTGTGLFHLAAYEATPGTFYFSGNEAGRTFSFSASEAAVPEPVSLVLFGSGLIGLAAVRRRMKA